MNKLFIVESADELKLEAASLIDSYLVNSVAGEEADQAKSNLQDINKTIQKAIIAIVAIIALLKIVKSSVKKNGNNDKSSNENLSQSTKIKIKNNEDDSLIAAACDVSIQEASAILNRLKSFKSDVDSCKGQITKIQKERNNLIKKFGDDPTIKAGADKRIKELDAEIKKITKDADVKSAKLKKEYNSVISKAKYAIGYGGDEENIDKLKKILADYKED